MNNFRGNDFTEVSPAKKSDLIRKINTPVKTNRKTVSFGKVTIITIGAEPMESSSQAGVDVKSFQRVKRDLEAGARLTTSEVKSTLQHCISINRDYSVVSKKSEALLLGALSKLEGAPDKTHSLSSPACGLIYAFADILSHTYATS